MDDTSLLAVTAIGTDRPGIVSAVTGALYELGCNLEDATSTILRGHFSITLIVKATRAPGEVEEALEPVGREFGLTLAVKPVEEADTAVVEPSHIVSVYGADRPGIVFRVSEALARKGANVTELASRLIGEDADPVYVLMLEVALPQPEGLEADMEALGADLGVDISVHPAGADIF
ncbi:MAG: glycine cleavage system protein R [Actinomycetota bacterium]